MAKSRVNIDDLKNEFIGKVFGWLTVVDIFRNDKNQITFKCQCKCGNISEIPKSNLFSGRVNSCGCYRYSKECMEKQYAWYNNHEKVEARNEKCRQWHRDHPNKAREIADVNKESRANNPEKYKAIAEHIQNAHRNNRLKCDFSALKDYVDCDTFNKLCNGEILSSDQISVYCPICGSPHKCALHNVYKLKSNTLKRNTVPICPSCLLSLTSSKYEQEITDFIRTFYTGKFIRNTRKIISPLELDIYYPDKNIAIEFNGDYWHSEEFRDRDYHYSKFNKCKESNILLVSIFESEWNSNNTAIKQYLCDLFSDKENDISFNEDKTLMNNDYPSPRYYQLVYDHIDYYTIYKIYKVFHCGYSKFSSQ
mgnify:CR=1 FL=1